MLDPPYGSWVVSSYWTFLYSTVFVFLSRATENMLLRLTHFSVISSELLPDRGRGGEVEKSRTFLQERGRSYAAREISPLRSDRGRTFGRDDERAGTLLLLSTSPCLPAGRDSARRILPALPTFPLVSLASLRESWRGHPCRLVCLNNDGWPCGQRLSGASRSAPEKCRARGRGRRTACGHVAASPRVPLPKHAHLPSDGALSQ